MYTALLLALKCSEKTQIEDEIRLTCKLGCGRQALRLISRWAKQTQERESMAAQSEMMQLTATSMNS